MAPRKKNKKARKRSRWQSRRPKRKRSIRSRKLHKLSKPLQQAFFYPPRSTSQYFALPPSEQQIWDSVAHVVSRMRNRISLRRAAREFGIASSLVVGLGGPAIRTKDGRYVATKTDRLLRVVSILKAKGRMEITTRDSRQASLIGSYWAAVQRYLQTGDDSGLLKLKKTTVVDASGKRHRLLTDLKELVRQASAGVLSFESIYAGGSR